MNRLVCALRGHLWYPARDGVSARDLPGGGWAFATRAVECSRCGQRRYAPEGQGS